MESLVAVVKKADCQKLRKHLESLNLYNNKYKCVQLNEHEIAIPLTNNATIHPELKNIEETTFMLNGIIFYIQNRSLHDISKIKNSSPSEKLQHMIKDVMIAKDLWQSSLMDEIPESWEKFDDLILFDSRKYFKHSNWELAGSELWLCVCSALNVKRIALKHHIKNDCYRTPSAELVWGDCTWVSSLDNGIRYSWNIEKNMFSVGNAPERHRIASFDCREEVVVDMYAGIGYFTLPYLIHAKAKLVYACEWNTDAIEALRNNLITNNVVGKCIIKEGDNRKVCPTNVADRVNLGLLPSSEDSWRAACLALKTTGGILHIHGNVSQFLQTSNCYSFEDRLSKLCRNRFDAASSLDNICKTCEKLINELPGSSSAAVLKDFFINSMSNTNHSFSIFTNNFILQNETNIFIQWKKTEFKIWSVHVCHCVATLLLDIHGEGINWKVSVAHLHNVKSYGPHINHLVLDVKCEHV